NPQWAVPLNVTGTLDMLGGTLKRSDATDAFSGSNGLQIGTGSSIWTGGTVALPALWINSGAVVGVPSGSTVLSGGQVVNLGKVLFSGGELDLRTTLNNGGTVEFAGSGTLSGLGTLFNAAGGSVTKSSGAGGATISARISDGGG